MEKPFTHVKNALLMPLNGTLDWFESGVFSQGVCLEASLLPGRSCAAEPKKPREKLRGNYLFGGYFFNHYGHFLTESLSRLYAWRQCPPFPLLFSSTHSAIRQRHVHIIRALGIRNELLMIRVPTEVESLIVSPPSCIVVPAQISEAQVEALGQIEGGEPVPGKKIWLSRSSYLRTGILVGGVINEEGIEKALAAGGWEIVHLEKMGSIQNQVRALCSAEHVAGFDGSAFLNVLLARKISGRFTIFGRQNSIGDINLLAVRRKGIACETYVPEVVPVSGEGAATRWFLPRPESVLDVLLGG